MHLRSTAAAALMAGALALTMPVAAQAQSDGGGQQSQQQQQVELTDQKFDAFVEAALAVMDVRAAWSPKIKGAESDEDAQSMMKSARQEMAQAVEDAPGISTREYIAIARQARQDSQLAERIEKRVRAAQQQSGQ